MSNSFEGYFTIGNDGELFEFVVHNGFMKAREQIWFTSAKTTDFVIPNPKTKEAKQFSQRLYDLARRGIKIRFILAPREAEKNFYQKLKDIKNIEFKFCYNMHMKIIVVDGTWAYFGSANLTGAGLGSRTRKGKNNFEVGTITIDQKVVKAIDSQLQQIWNGNECQGCYQKQKGYCKGID
ncbi:MAG: phospholipase D family protein [Candidatus Heimdallarchaeota archaeon]|nr:phospholipase D family protein [Candidatus Heimdallarchaeota archaeon]